MGQRHCQSWAFGGDPFHRAPPRGWRASVGGACVALCSRRTLPTPSNASRGRATLSALPRPSRSRRCPPGVPRSPPAPTHPPSVAYFPSVWRCGSRRRTDLPAPQRRRRFHDARRRCDRRWRWAPHGAAAWRCRCCCRRFVHGCCRCPCHCLGSGRRCCFRCHHCRCRCRHCYLQLWLPSLTPSQQCGLAPPPPLFTRRSSSPPPSLPRCSPSVATPAAVAAVAAGRCPMTPPTWTTPRRRRRCPPSLQRRWPCTWYSHGGHCPA